MPKISVIVPVYNVEKYIAKCLKSIKDQNFDDFECLIIDDGSKDKSIEIAKTVIEGDSRFKLFHKENGGLSDARNYGIEKASGEYLAFIDSDDYLDRELLSSSYEMAKKHDSDITCFDMYYVWPDGNMTISSGANQEVSSYKDNHKLIFINNSANNKLYKYSFMQDKRFIKGMWYEDLAIIPTWIAQANNVSYVNKALYYYVQRAGSISHSADERIFDIYKSLTSVENALGLSSDDLIDLYLDNCLLMTTLRIRDIDDNDLRKAFYLRNVDCLDTRCPNWYQATKNRPYSYKQRIIFYLLKHRKINLLDRIYRR